MKIKLKASFLIIGLFFSVHNASAAALTFVSDTISSSIPGASANHTVKFTTTTQIPVNGKIIIKPQANSFRIPTLFSITDIDMSINGVEQTLEPFPSLSGVGVQIINGINGSFSFTFPSAVSPMSEVIVKLGKNANIGGSGVKQIKNPVSVASYRISIESKNSINIPIDNASAMIATIFPVSTKNPPPIPFSAEKISAFDPDTLATITLINTNNTQFRVTTPAGVVNFLDEILLHIFAFDKADTETIAPTPAGKYQVGKAYELTMIRLSDETTVTGFSQNVTFDMYYDDSDVLGIDENSLRIHKWHGTEWLPVSGSTVFPSENRASAEISSFSMYTIIGDASQSSSNDNTTTGGSSGSNQAISPIAMEPPSREVTTTSDPNTPKIFPVRVFNNIKNTFNNLIGKDDTTSDGSVNKKEDNKTLPDIMPFPIQSGEKNKLLKIAFIFFLALFAIAILLYFWEKRRR